MLAEFSTKFSSFVELAPVTFKNFSFKEEWHDRIENFKKKNCNKTLDYI